MDYVTNNELLLDDLMLEIFNHLNVKDLCIAAQVSKQFQRLAQYTFKTKYSKFKLLDHFDKINLKTLKQLFFNFGQFMEHLEISSTAYPPIQTLDFMETYTMWLIKQNCRAENRLKTLKLLNFTRIGSNFLSLNILLPNLEVIELNGISLSYSINQLLSKLPKIREFSVSNCFPKFPILHNAVTKFNPNLKIFKLDCSDIFYPIDALTQIDDHFPNIEELKCVLLPYNQDEHIKYGKGLKKISKLKMLKKLNIDFESHHITPFMQQLVANEVQLEIFHIQHCEFSIEAVNNLCQLKSIRQLGLSRNFNLPSEHLIQLAIYLPNLEVFSAINFDTTLPIIERIINIAKNLTKAEFELNRENNFSQYSFEKIISIVQAQNKKEQFKLYIHNYLNRPTNGLENAILEFNAQNNMVQLQSDDLIGPSILFD